MVVPNRDGCPEPRRLLRTATVAPNRDGCPEPTVAANWARFDVSGED